MQACRLASCLPGGSSLPRLTTASAFTPITSLNITARRSAARPSPGIFLAALAQRTTRLRFGPMVYLLPFYHPLRLIEEVCMLDQMSGGRLELGIGRGVSPFETANYALDFAQDAADVSRSIPGAAQGPRVGRIDFAGKFYRFDKVPMILHPVQRPHPPLWYGVGIPENADWPAQNDVNILALGPRATVGPIFERYHAVRRKLGMADTTLCGVGRHVVVAETDDKALAIARRAYPRWRTSFFWLFERNSSAPRTHAHYPETFDELQALGTAHRRLAGDRAQFHRRDVKATGANYWTPWLAFGDMTTAEALHSIDLFAREVMPAFG